MYVSFKNVSTLESLYVTSVQKEMALNNISIYNIVILILAVWEVQCEKGEEMRGEGGALYMFVRIGKVIYYNVFYIERA